MIIFGHFNVIAIVLLVILMATKVAIFARFLTFRIVDTCSKFDFLVPVSVLAVNNLTFSDNQLVSVLITDSLIRFDLMVTSKSLATLSNHF